MCDEFILTRLQRFFPVNERKLSVRKNALFLTVGWALALDELYLLCFLQKARVPSQAKSIACY